MTDDAAGDSASSTPPPEPRPLPEVKPGQVFQNRARRRARGAVRASATRIQLGNRQLAKAQAGTVAEWQKEAFEYFDDVALVKYVVWFLGNQLSKLRLFAAVRPLDDPEGAPIPVTDPESGISPQLAAAANAEIVRIKGKTGGLDQVLRMLNMNFEIAGEGYLICIGPRIATAEVDGETVETLTLESWEVRSILETTIAADGKVTVRDAQTKKKIELDPAQGDQAIRFWQPHPGWANKPDCHMRGVLTDCEAYILLTNEVKAESKSRQNNGILAIPNTMSVTLPSRPAVQPTDDEDDEEAIDALDEIPDDEEEPAAATIGEVLEEAIMEPIEDPSSAWSVFPMVLIGPAEDLKEIRHIPIERKHSEVLESRIEARKVSIAEGLNAPPEVARGHMATTFANAEVIDADIFEKHLQPRAVLVCDLWTSGLLHEPLIAAGYPEDEVERVLCWYDASALTKDVDPSESADKGIELDAISDEAWRRYKGFSEDDAPPPLDRLIRAILKQRMWDPGLVAAIVEALDPGLDVPEPAAPGAPPAPPNPNASLLAALGRLQSEGPDSDARWTVLRALTQLRDASAAIRASAKPDTKEAGTGARLAAIDRDLLTKLLPDLNASMTRALERAGSRLKARQGPTHRTLQRVNPLYSGRMLGPQLLAELGIHPDDLFDDDAFAPALDRFELWASDAQKKALKLAATLAGLSAGRLAQLREEQAGHLADAKDWLGANLRQLAHERLYEPDPREPERGEFNPSSRIPAGLGRIAIAMAGGAVSLEMVGSRESFVATGPDGGSAGGIGTGKTVSAAIVETDEIVVEGWQWDYGDGFRRQPFEPHEELDGMVMESAADFVTDPADAFVGDYLFPGDHEGCQCGELIPVYARAPQDVLGGDAGTGLDDPERGPNLLGGE